MTRIQMRNGAAATWTSVNPILSVGEWGVESDTGKAKMGTGVTAWNSLAYFSSGGGGGGGTVGFNDNNLVTRWGADPTGVADATDALQNAFAANDSDQLIIPGGSYKFSGASRIVMPVAVHVRGMGEGKTLLNFTNLNGGLDWGTFDTVNNVVAKTGSFSDLTLDGNNTCRNPFQWLFTTGTRIDNLEVTRGGLDAANPDNSAAIIMRRTQNVLILGMRVNNHRGHGIIIDDGAGGINWVRGRIGDCGNGGANVHNLWTRNISTAPRYAYPTPSDLFFDGVFIEALNVGQDIGARIDSLGGSSRLAIQSTIGKDAKRTATMWQLDSTTKVNFDNAAFLGDFAGDSSGMTLMKLLPNAKGTSFGGTPTKFQQAGTGINIDAGADVTFNSEPLWGSLSGAVTTRFAGAGAHKVTRSYITRTAVGFEAIPTSQNRGEVTYVPGGSAAVADKFTVAVKTSAGADSYIQRDLLAPTPLNVQRQDPAGSAATILPGTDSFEGRLSALTPGLQLTVPVPPAVGQPSRFVLIRLFHPNTGTRPYALLPSTVGSTTELVGDPINDAASKSGTLATNTQDILVLAGFGDGKWYVRKTSVGAVLS